MKFILASQNRHKLVEMQDILSAHGVEVVLQGDLGLHVEVEETGSLLCGERHAEGKSCHGGQRPFLPLPTTPAYAWTLSMVRRASTPPGTAVRSWTMWAAISCC